MTKVEIYAQTLSMLTMLIPFKKAQLNNPSLSFEENNKNENEYYSLIALKDSYEKLILKDSKKKRTDWYYNRKDYCECGRPKSVQSTNCATCSPIYHPLRKCDKKLVIQDVLRGDLTFKQVGIIHGISESSVNKHMVNYRKELKNENKV